MLTSFSRCCLFFLSFTSLLTCTATNADDEISLEPQKLVLRSLGEEITCDLPELRVDRKYSLRIELLNRTHKTLTLSKVGTSCGCVVATASDKEIAAGQALELILTITIGTIDDVGRLLTLLGDCEGESCDLGYITLKGPVIQPVSVFPSEVELKPDEDQRLIQFELRSTLNDVNLVDTELRLVGDWCRQQEVVSKSKQSIQSQALLSPRSGTDLSSQMLARFSYQDRDGIHVTEVPILLRRIPRLSVRPAELWLKGGEEVTLKMFLVGDFGDEGPIKVNILQQGSKQHFEPLLSTEIRPMSNKMLVVSHLIPFARFNESKGILKVKVGNQVTTVPFQFLED